MKRFIFRLIRAIKDALRTIEYWADPHTMWKDGEWHDCDECVGCGKTIDTCCEEFTYLDPDGGIKVHYDCVPDEGDDTVRVMSCG